MRRNAITSLSVSELTLADLEKITSAEEVRHAHQTAGLFLVKRGGKAHSSMTCIHNSDTDFVDNPMWGVADQLKLPPVLAKRRRASSHNNPWVT